MKILITVCYTIFIQRILLRIYRAVHLINATRHILNAL